MLQQVLPPGYFGMSDEETYPRIRAAKQRLGSRLMILGHHYQRDEVIQFADLTGDSFGLSRDAAANRDARYIVFCGVHFMAESADILTRDEQVVILPDLEAGCSMADMADLDQVEDAWDEISEVYSGGAASLGAASLGAASLGAAPLGATPGSETVMPITYINSAANLKAFVGEHGGAVCTSSNAAPIIRWALTQRERLLFFPDQHLGRNTAVKMGIPLEQMIVWDPRRPPGEYGGNKREDVERAKIILWRGHCQVHQRFLPEHVRSFRAKFPGINIIVHPECSYEVVQMADHVGSTASILKTINQAPAGTSWAVGTEIHLVDRIRRANPDKFVSSLVPGVCLCSTMNRIDPQHLLWVLENLEKDRIVNQIRVPEPVASRAKEALDRMLAIS